MPLNRSQVLAFFATLLGFATPLLSHADETLLSLSQFHFRMGLLGGTVKSLSYGSTLSISNALDLEYETSLEPRRSVFIHTILGYDMSTARTPYASLAAGYRFYVSGFNTGYNMKSGADHFERRPKLRIYLGPELGLAQINVQQVGPVLGVATTAIEVGGSAGAIYQMGKTWGLELEGAYQLGYGFANVTASSSLYRIFAGACLSF